MKTVKDRQDTPQSINPLKKVSIHVPLGREQYHDKFPVMELMTNTLNEDITEKTDPRTRGFVAE
jgi:hypothetical protein